MITGLTILFDILLLIANYAVLLRIIYGTWTLRIPKSVERETKPLKDVVNKNAFPYFFIWILCALVIVIGSYILSPQIFFSIYPIFLLIGLSAGIIFGLTIFRK
jgi:predicted permease